MSVFKRRFALIRGVLPVFFTAVSVYLLAQCLVAYFELSVTRAAYDACTSVAEWPPDPLDRLTRAHYWMLDRSLDRQYGNMAGYFVVSAFVAIPAFITGRRYRRGIHILIGEDVPMLPVGSDGSDTSNARLRTEVVFSLRLPRRAPEQGSISVAATRSKVGWCNEREMDMMSIHPNVHLT